MINAAQDKDAKCLTKHSDKDQDQVPFLFDRHQQRFGCSADNPIILLLSTVLNLVKLLSRASELREEVRES